MSYPNATPIEVERKVTLPIEEALATVSRVKQIQASSNRGGASVNIEFLPGTDMDQVYAEVRDRLDRVRPELPEAVEQVRARHWDANDSPIMWMGVTFDTGIIDPVFLMENYVQPALQRLDGVGQVEVWGDGRPEVLIEIDEDRVRGHGIDLFTVVRNLRSQNFALSGGRVREGGRRLMVRSAGRFESVDQIRETVVDARHNLRLADIAKIELVRVRSSWTHHVNGNQSLGIGNWRTSGANLVQVTHQVHETLDRVLARPELQGIDVEVFWDQGKHVRESVDNLKTSGLWGGLFAALVLLFFLRALRMTLIITLAIPLSILVTVTALYFVGWSLNLATMMGLMLSLGLVVDNAIVIVENIYRKRQSGANPRNASVEGTGEVSLAVTMATLTTVVVFLPLMLMSDDERFSFWMIRIGMPVIVGLVASLIIAMIFIPVAAQRLPVQEGKADSRFLTWLQERYLRSLKWVLHHRLDTLIVVLLAMASIQLPLAGMKKTDEGQGNSRRLRLEVEMPSGQTQSQADRFVATVEDTLINHIYEYHVKAVRTWYRTGHATFELLFKEEESLDWYRVALDNLAIRFGWGYPFNRSYHMFSAWRILALASTTRARLASFKPGFEPMRTAWAMLHRLRSVLVRPGRDLLSGTVQVDETYIGGAEPGLAGGRARGKKVLTGIAVEVHEPRGLGRCRMSPLADASAETLHAFVMDHVEPGSTIITDGWPAYQGLAQLGYEHDRRSQGAARARGDDPNKLLPAVHRVVSLAKRWLLGTHQGAADSTHMSHYLNEFVFRFNRRRSRSRGMVFYRGLELAVAHEPMRFQDLIASRRPRKLPPEPPKRRGHPTSLERPGANRPWRSAAEH